MKRILVAQPAGGPSIEESFRSAFFSTNRRKDYQVDVFHKGSSLLARSFNICLKHCLNNDYDYFAMLHIDMAADGPWIDTLMDVLNEGRYDHVHAPAVIKDRNGETSTAVAYSDDVWAVRRKITTTELQALPEVFDAKTLREVYDPAVKYLLPNTGCMLMPAKTWLRDFPGFELRDRLTKQSDGTYEDEGVSEDWLMGYWLGRNELRAACTKRVVTRHFGRMEHPNTIAYGSPVDRYWQSKQPQLQEV